MKLIDFGLSDTDSHAILKTAAGTEGYMAPEGASDIYSLGCILCEMDLGRTSDIVIHKCLAPLHVRYGNVFIVKRDLHCAWYWPKRLLVAILILVIALCLYLSGLSGAKLQFQSELSSYNDSLANLKQATEAKADFIQASADSLQSRVQTLDLQRQSTLNRQQQLDAFIAATKLKIDHLVHISGVQQMFDTVSCQSNVSLPFIRIADDLLRFAEEEARRGGQNESERQTLKTVFQEYVQERYRKPWLKQMSELPFD